MQSTANRNYQALSNGADPKRRLLELRLRKELEQLKTAGTIKKAARAGSRLPLSFSQERLWFLDQTGLTGEAYNVPLALRINGQLNCTALERSFNALIERHESLRTCFGNDRGTPYQSISPQSSVEVRVCDWSAMEDNEARGRRLQELLREESRYRFNLACLPLIRVLLVKLAPSEHVLSVTLHHIVADGWSIGILVRELGELYAAFSQGVRSTLAPLPLQYADFAIWQRATSREDELQNQLQYWKMQLAGAHPQLQLPSDHPRPAVQSFRGALVRFELPREVVMPFERLAQAEGATLFMAALTAFKILLFRWSGQSDIVVGTPVAARKERAVEGLIGFFVNTLALRTQIEATLSFPELLRRVKHTTLGAYSHQDVPFERLVTELRAERSLSHQPIFQVMLALHNFPKEEMHLPGLVWNWMNVDYTTAHFDLTVYLREVDGGLAGELEYATDMFDRVTMERTAERFCVLVRSIIRSPNLPIGRLTVLSAAEEEQVLAAWNAQRTGSARYEHCVHELFEAQVQRSPDATALIHADQYLSYGELERRSNQLARLLRERGVSTGHPVGICAERGLAMVVGLLAILKSGAPYIPLDPHYPPERLRQMLDDSGPALILTQRDLQGRLPPERSVLLLEDVWGILGQQGGAPLLRGETQVTPEHLAYIIFTSGSTGRPKGICMPHRSMANLLDWHREVFAANPGQRVLQFAALSFDVAFQETFSTLCTGSTLVLIQEETRRDARALTRLLADAAIERLFLPPLMLQFVAEHVVASDCVPSHLQDVITAGEQLRISPEIVRLFQRIPGCRVHNHYGPTETHVVTALTLTGDPEQWPLLPSIGRPIPNAQAYVLDESRQPVPIGASGELYIGGVAVADGYWGRSELTAQRFVRDPFSRSLKGRLYRTGDLARWTNEGLLEYQGRNDDQIKIRGYRVELGEIESQLVSHPKVKEAAVIARDEGSEKRLVAYVVSRDAGLDIDDLRALLKNALPDFMVPSAIVVLPSLPLTPNGKLDRRALPVPEQNAYATRDYEPAQGFVEQRLAAIWSSLLGITQVGRHDHFFELGGHSLLVLKVLAHIEQEMGASLKITDLYRYPTLSSLAARVSGLAQKNERVDLSKEAVLDPDVVPSGHCWSEHSRGIFLTGCSGFVGRFILEELARTTDQTIYCLIRARSSEEASARLEACIRDHGLAIEAGSDRFVAVCGDLRQPQLGIPDGVYQTLTREVDSIYHCATSMNHLETYPMAKSANVAGTRELLRLAVCQQPKLVNYISTTGIFRETSDGAARTVSERTPIEAEAHFVSDGYLASKWVSEKLCMLANERGIACNILRLGLAWADSRHGRFDSLQHVYRLIKSALLCGYGIQEFRYATAPIPVDYMARAVVRLGLSRTSKGEVYHIASDLPSGEGLFEQCNRAMGLGLELLPFYDWIKEVKRLHEAGRSLPIVPLLEFAFDMEADELEGSAWGTGKSTTRCDSTLTRRKLEAVGVSMPPFEDHLVRLCVERMLASDSDLKGVSHAARFA